MLALSLPEEFAIAHIQPSSNPELKTASGIIAVTTNNATGYTLTAEIDNTTTNNLVNTYSSDYEIENLTSNTTPTDFPVNHWGYSLDNPTSFSSFSPLPAIGDTLTLKETDSPSATSTTNFSIGTKINADLASGDYTNKIKFSAVTNYVPPAVTSFDKAYQQAGKSKATASDDNEYYQMKDMDTSICNAVTAPASASAEDTQTGTLVDTRDGKTYQVAKLLDGNCWMTENLRLGSGTQSYNLTSADSNVSSDWTLPAMPTSTSWTPTYTEPMLYPSDDQNTDSTKGALGYYGYYYNWNAATAGTGNNTQMEAQYDICPKGWSLPADYSVNPNRSYAKLLVDHGVISSASSESYATGGYTKMTSAPLQFVLSGSHSNSGTSVNYRGSNGDYWSSSSYYTTYAYDLCFDSFYVSPQFGNDKRAGSVVRCLAL